MNAPAIDVWSKKPRRITRPRCFNSRLRGRVRADLTGWMQEGANRISGMLGRWLEVVIPDCWDEVWLEI